MKISNTNMDHFQIHIADWMCECFGEQTAQDRTERSFRFLEEALELVQSLGCDSTDAHSLVEYVFNRPVGRPHQEVGGVMVTLSALCSANGVSLCRAALDEAERIHEPVIMNKIRKKHMNKPHKSPLPGDYKYPRKWLQNDPTE